MTKKKLSTQDILAAARAQSQGGDGGAKKEDDAPETTGQESSTTQDPGKKKSGGPKSTADILAAARAQSGGGGEKKPSGGSKSTNDILAAARAQAGGGSAAAKTPSKEAAPAKSSGDHPSVQEMLKAVREGQKPQADTTGKPKLPPQPKKPVAGKAKAATKQRRNILAVLFLAPFALASFLFSLTAVLWTLATARFMMPNVLVEPPSNFKIGPPSDYPFGMVSTKWKAQFGVWIIHTSYDGKNQIYAILSVCTHLGCTPNWLEGEQKFKCPCHGSGFYINGVNFEGPAPRPLERVGIRLAEDGMLEVDKSVKFQEEMGQWQDAASFVEIA